MSGITINTDMYFLTKSMSDEITNSVVALIISDFKRNAAIAATDQDRYITPASVQDVVKASVDDMINRIIAGHVKLPEPVEKSEKTAIMRLKSLTRSVDFYATITSRIMLCLLDIERSRAPSLNQSPNSHATPSGFPHATPSLTAMHYGDGIVWSCKGARLPNGQPVVMHIMGRTFTGRLVVKNGVSGVLTEDGGFFNTLREAATHNRKAVNSRYKPESVHVNGWVYWMTEVDGIYYTLRQIRDGEVKLPPSLMTALSDTESEPLPPAMWTTRVRGKCFSAPDQTPISMTYGGVTFFGKLIVVTKGKTKEFSVETNDGMIFSSLGMAASYCAASTFQSVSGFQSAVKRAMCGITYWRTKGDDGVWRRIIDQIS